MNATDTNMIIYNTQDGRASVVLYARDGSVWMNQNQLAELFDIEKIKEGAMQLHHEQRRVWAEIDLDALAERITPNTQGIIINSPNNPSGVVYTRQTLQALAALLTTKGEEYGHPIYIIADEPYRELVYGEVKVPYLVNEYKNTVVCYSYSKSLSLPGERIGYILVPQEAFESKALYAAVAGAGRALGYVCAPSMMQKVITLCQGQTGDVELYKKNRDLLYEGLTKIGYECFKPQGAFYMFVKALEEPLLPEWNTDLTRYLADTYLCEQKYKEAFPLCETLVTEYPDNVECQLQYAEVLYLPYTCA